MNVAFDLSDFDAFLEEARKEVRRRVTEIGHEAVAYAQSEGNYEDQTGNLRASNDFEVEEDGSLIISNDAPYASYVESKGFDVITGAALFAERRLHEEFEE